MAGISFIGNNGAFTGTAAALGTITGTQGRGIVFKVVTSGTETVSVAGLISEAVASSKYMCYSLLTGALHSSADMDDGTYFIPRIYTHDLTFTGSSTSDTKTVTYRMID